jgi:hypothetical protein
MTGKTILQQTSKNVQLVTIGVLPNTILEVGQSRGVKRVVVGIQAFNDRKAMKFDVFPRYGSIDI